MIIMSLLTIHKAKYLDFTKPVNFFSLAICGIRICNIDIYTQILSSPPPVSSRFCPAEATHGEESHCGDL